MKAMIVSVMAVGAVVAVGAPGYTEGAVVTAGEFHVFAAGVGNPAYANVAGRAHMVRTAEGKTVVKVNISGLSGNTTYGSHVHTLACGDNTANGHYRFNPAGDPTPPNEIWPAFTTNEDGAGNGKAVSEWRAGSTAVSVVVHAPGGAKIACADLA